ncbi:MAG TPA: esterase, partial [Ramlibacter sp.]|nr:esterase [Ramlibacter sp.]
MKKLHALTAVAVAVLLVACGGGDGDGVSRGALLETPQTVTTLTAAQINATATGAGLQALSGPALCDVRMMSLNYSTVGVNAESTNASGVMLVPAGACASDSFPLVAYAKGTDV